MWRTTGSCCVPAIIFMRRACWRRISTGSPVRSLLQSFGRLPEYGTIRRKRRQQYLQKKTEECGWNSTSLSAVSYTHLASEEGWKPYEWQDDETCPLIFTSGSTGTPKGVRLSQGNIFARTMAEIQRYQLDETEVDLNWMTLTHAAGIIWSLSLIHI